MSDRWDHIEALFEVARERPEAEREAFLREAAGEDEALFREVMDLLVHSEQAKKDWGDSAVTFAKSLLHDFAETTYERGTQIGPYTLERILGRGGMGTVWLAERADDLRLKVALKIIRHGLDTEDVRKRFRREHHVLATLDHPGIARLLDGGVTPDGLPYFALEFVDGEPIDVYCDRCRLTIPERLELVRQVCAAVQYAHQRLVVHRDLKPSNILVAEDSDGVPRVKLLDFGIAKVLNPDDLELSEMLTGPERRLLTPAYASPEQIRGEPITTASDVFQLGVLLYELLTGRTPETSRKTLVETEPTRPSEIVRHPTTRTLPDGTINHLSPDAISSARQITSDRLRKALAGDLDIIVLTALRNQPERRYASAGQLADDLANHLEGRAVNARPDSLGYQLTVFARRHRTGVAAALLAILVLIGFAAAMTVERARTEREAAKAQAIADVLSGLFAASNPTLANGDTLTVLDFLHLSEGRLREDLADQPEVLATVLLVIGTAYRDMRAFDRAEPALRESLALRRRIHGSRHHEVAETLGHLATMLYMNYDLEAALEAAHEYRVLLTALYGRQDLRLIPAFGRIATIHMEANQLDSARVTLDAGNAITRAHIDSDPNAHLRLLGLEAWYFAEIGQHEESVRIAHEILDLRIRTDAPLLSRALTERILGNSYYLIGEFERAEHYLNESLRHYRQVLGDDNLYVSLVLGHLAETAAADGDVERADSLFALALPMKERFFGDNRAEVGYTLIRYGHHARMQGRLSEADSLLDRAEQLWTELRGPDNPNLQIARAERALVWLALGETAAASDTLEALWARVSSDPPTRHRATLQLRLAQLRRYQGRTAEADSLTREATPFLHASPYRNEL